MAVTEYKHTRAQTGTSSLRLAARRYSGRRESSTFVQRHPPKAGVNIRFIVYRTAIEREPSAKILSVYRRIKKVCKSEDGA